MIKAFTVALFVIVNFRQIEVKGYHIKRKDPIGDNYFSFT